MLVSSYIVVEEPVEVNTSLLSEKLAALRLPLGLDKGVVGGIWKRGSYPIVVLVPNPSLRLLVGLCLVGRPIP